MPNRKTNLIFFGIDSLRPDHTSLYGYRRLTTPHMDRYLKDGTVFENVLSPHIPTTPGYSSMFTGMDAFGTDCVALRHKGQLGSHVATMAEVLGEQGYETVCVGFSGNPASRGFQKYVDFSGWGSWMEGRSPKAENLNAVALPELVRMANAKKPFFLFLRHMDPHAPYLPPRPFERMFYHGNEMDPANRSLDPVYSFKPFCDFFKSWFPPGCTDKDYIIAQYDGEVAYMDACIEQLLTTIATLGLEEDTLVVFDSDHGETHYDHGCHFDHHGLYECTVRIPLAFRMPGRVAGGRRYGEPCQMKDIAPTVYDLMGIKTNIRFDGRSLVPLMEGTERVSEPEAYITECTWMRKHGWRTPEWKLIHALEPDFHHKPEVELYNLVSDPGENTNLADKEPEVVKWLEARMQAHIQRREKETGRTNPMYTNLDWHGQGVGPFKTSDQAYNTLYIGSPQAARELQEKALKELEAQRGARPL
ncbi:MAG TPA: sulfatase [Spirochaetia bacterium]|nr:sulfatase [Spirochaetia bacterium]